MLHATDLIFSMPYTDIFWVWRLVLGIIWTLEVSLSFFFLLLPKQLLHHCNRSLFKKCQNYQQKACQHHKVQNN